jgi:2,5-diketo-D-gluconate reductase A
VSRRRCGTPQLTLASGVLIPQVGFGTWPLLGDAATAAVSHALSAGYRLIDTSEQYGNEEAVGEALRDSSLSRSEIFLTSMFNVEWHGVDLAQAACERALQRLGVEYLDLMLIHWPNPWLDRYVDAWRGLIAARKAGLTRAIGVSNFLPDHIDRLREETRVTPEVNQIELDPTLPQCERRAYHDAHGIVTQAWGPLGRDGRLLRDPVVIQLADRHNVAPAQIILRWHLQQGLAFTARSSDPGRIAQNMDLFGFSLTDDDVDLMGMLDVGRPPERDPSAHGH